MMQTGSAMNENVAGLGLPPIHEGRLAYWVRLPEFRLPVNADSPEQARAKAWVLYPRLTDQALPVSPGYLRTGMPDADG